jgi:hypothetical protein
MTGGEDRPRSSWAAGNVLFSVAFVVAVAALAMVFHGGLTANPAARLLTVFGIVENGSLRADRWFDLSIDGALVAGHVYSDKAPLSSFLVVPFYWLWRVVERGPQTAADMNVAVIMGDLVTAALPFGAFAALLQRHAARSTSQRDAVWIALLAAFGTCVFGSAGTYLGNVLAGALLVFAYHFATSAPERHAYVAGLLAGLAVLAEYPLFVGAAILGVYLATRGAKLAIRYAAGALPCAVAMFAYDAAITGSPFDFPQRYVRPQFFPPWGRRFALDAQALHAARALLFSEYRGLFVYAPMLLLLLPLAVMRAESAARRGVFLAIAIGQFAVVASYWAWDGGWSIGPRHLVALTMLLVYEGVGALARTPRARPWFAGLASIGLALNLVAVATNPPFQGAERPFRQLYWPAFLRGEIAPDNVFRELGHPCGLWGLAIWCGLFLLSGALLVNRSPGEQAAGVSAGTRTRSR